MAERTKKNNTCFQVLGGGLAGGLFWKPKYEQMSVRMTEVFLKFRDEQRNIERTNTWSEPPSHKKNIHCMVRNWSCFPVHLPWPRA